MISQQIITTTATPKILLNFILRNIKMYKTLNKDKVELFFAFVFGVLKTL